jgi:hypothetical protein
MASIFCLESVPDFEQLSCGTELGGIVAFALVDKSLSPTKTDLQTKSYWQQKTAASPQKMWIIQDTRGTYPGGTPVEEEGFGKTPTLRTGADHEASIEVRGVEENRDFWAAVNQTDKWGIVFFTNDDLGFFAENVSVYAKIDIQQSIKTSIKWMVSCKWSDDMSNPLVFDASAIATLYS